MIKCVCEINALRGYLSCDDVRKGMESSGRWKRIGSEFGMNGFERNYEV